jgi:molybdate transport system ATP-binding protein
MRHAGFDIEAVVERTGGDGPAFRLEARLEAPGGITVVYGPSGAGKSTLLMTVLGALRPQCGRVTVGDRTVFDSSSGVDLPVHRRRVGIVFQDALLFPHLTVRANVAYGAPDRRRGAACADALLERVGAADLAERVPRELSGGQRQRVALARALAAEPDGLLLDEPFSALDTTARNALGQLLRALQADSGIPFLHVTHDLGEAVRLGSHLVLIDNGRVVEQGPPARVFATPASLAAARAVGTENLFHGEVVAHHPGDGCTEVDLGGTRVQIPLGEEPLDSRLALGLRAEEILVSLEPVQHTSARNVVEGEIREMGRSGPLIELRVVTPVSFRVLLTPASVDALRLAPGGRVHLLIKAAAIHRLGAEP